MAAAPVAQTAHEEHPQATRGEEAVGQVRPFSAMASMRHDRHHGQDEGHIRLGPRLGPSAPAARRLHEDGDGLQGRAGQDRQQDHPGDVESARGSSRRRGPPRPVGASRRTCRRLSDGRCLMAVHSDPWTPRRHPGSPARPAAAP